MMYGRDWVWVGLECFLKAIIPDKRVTICETLKLGVFLRLKKINRD